MVQEKGEIKISLLLIMKVRCAIHEMQKKHFTLSTVVFTPSNAYHTILEYYK